MVNRKKKKYSKSVLFQDLTNQEMLVLYKEILVKLNELKKCPLDFVEEIKETQTEIQLIVLECTERGLTYGQF